MWWKLHFAMIWFLMHWSQIVSFAHATTVVLLIPNELITTMFYLHMPRQLCYCGMFTNLLCYLQKKWNCSDMNFQRIFILMEKASVKFVASTHWNWMQFSVISNWFHHINTLTHCNLVARYWITELGHHIGSGNVMLPVWCQAITWTNDDFTFF